jgi:hypothetical protein
LRAGPPIHDSQYASAQSLDWGGFFEGGGEALQLTNRFLSGQYIKEPAL